MRQFYRGLIRQADVAAVSLGQEYVGAEHLLLAIAAEGQTTPAMALAVAGVAPEAIRVFLARLPVEPNSILGSPLPLAPSARLALEGAAAWVRRLQPCWPRREYLLLGILEVRCGVVPLLLEGLGAEPDRIRAELLRQPASRA